MSLMINVQNYDDDDDCNDKWELDIGYWGFTGHEQMMMMMMMMMMMLMMINEQNDDDDEDDDEDDDDDDEDDDDDDEDEDDDDDDEDDDDDCIDKCELDIGGLLVTHTTNQFLVLHILTGHSYICLSVMTRRMKYFSYLDKYICQFGKIHFAI